MTEQTSNKRQRRMARQPSAPPHETAPRAPSRLDQLEQLLTGENGASIAEMVEATGWQPHSVRGAMAGALKKRGIGITSERVDGTRRYRGVKPA